MSYSVSWVDADGDGVRARSRLIAPPHAQPVAPLPARLLPAGVICVASDAMRSQGCGASPSRAWQMLDLFVGCNQGHNFYRNTPSAAGGFTSMTDGAIVMQGEIGDGFGACWSDYNLDGRPDLFLGSANFGDPGAGVTYTGVTLLNIPMRYHDVNVRGASSYTAC